MVSNPYRADLLQERLDTLELMTALAWEYKRQSDTAVRDGLEACIKELGEISQEYTRMIAASDPMPEKWVTYYELREKLYARDK